jgi:BMFP domain-containing protein YqiC
MIDADFLRKLSAKAADLFPAAESARQRLEQDLYRLLQGSLARFNVVTREEFDAQARVLQQAQAQITALEAKVAALESAAPR